MIPLAPQRLYHYFVSLYADNHISGPPKHEVEDVYQPLHGCKAEFSLVVNVDKTLGPLVEYTTLPSGNGKTLKRQLKWSSVRMMSYAFVLKEISDLFRKIPEKLCLIFVYSQKSLPTTGNQCVW